MRGPLNLLVPAMTKSWDIARNEAQWLVFQTKPSLRGEERLSGVKVGVERILKTFIPINLLLGLNLYHLKMVIIPFITIYFIPD